LNAFPPSNTPKVIYEGVRILPGHFWQSLKGLEESVTFIKSPVNKAAICHEELIFRALTKLGKITGAQTSVSCQLELATIH
jgi:hypothetical protein